MFFPWPNHQKILILRHEKTGRRIPNPQLPKNQPSMRTILIALLLAFACAMPTTAQKNDDSYDVERGVEEYEKGNTAEALNYFDKAIQRNPKSRQAHLNRARALFKLGDNERALDAANAAIKCTPKKLKEDCVENYLVKGGVLMALSDMTGALSAFGQAIALNPDDPRPLKGRGDAYLIMDRYPEAEADYKGILAINDGFSDAYFSLAACAANQRKYDEAIAYCDKFVALNPRHAHGYSFRAQMHLDAGHTDEATSDVVTALDIDREVAVAGFLGSLKDEALDKAIVKLRCKAMKYPSEAIWPYYIAHLYLQDKQHRKAISYFQKCNALHASASIFESIADCYSDMEDYTNALHYLNLALEADERNSMILAKISNAYYYLAQPDKALETMTKFIEAEPEFYFGYYRRGFINDNMHHIDEAIADYTKSIELEPAYAYSYLGRADMYMLKGEEALAKSDYETVCRIDSMPSTRSTTPYALLALGRKGEALAFSDSIISRFPDDNGAYYDAACLRARMGDTAEALRLLRISMEKGNRELAHMRLDDDMDSLRELPEYKALMDEYEAILAEEISANAAADGTIIATASVTTEVPLTKESGQYRMACVVNGVPINATYDASCTAATISNLDASFLVKNGYVTATDFLGNKPRLDANGQLPDGTRFLLRKIEIGDLVLENLTLTVKTDQQTTLILGPSAFVRLGKAELDTTNRVLKVTHK